MTIKEKLEAKLQELEELKSKLINLSHFNNPDNDTTFYSDASVKDLRKTQGVTPKNVGEVLMVVIKTVNEYIDYINKLDYASVASVMRDRIVKNYKIISSISDISGIDPDFDLQYTGVDFQSLVPYLPDAEYSSPVKNISITGAPVLRSGTATGDTVNIGAVFININPRLGVNNSIRFPNGVISASLSSALLGGDDLFIVGIYAKEDLSQYDALYMDFTYRVDISFDDGTTDTKLYSIANKKIGVEENNFDSTRPDAIIAWDALSVNRVDFSIINTQGDSTSIATSVDRPIGGGSFAGNIVSQILIGAFSSDMAEYQLSYRDNCAYYRGLYDTVYDLYMANEEAMTPIVIPNLKPIDEVLYDALRDI